jgi:hypothetical protein
VIQRWLSYIFLFALLMKSLLQLLHLLKALLHLLKALLHLLKAQRANPLAFFHELACSRSW